MSEYTPITDGLRESMARMHVFGRPMVQKEEADFNRMCDAIDSAYAQLEHENAALKAELDCVLGEQYRDGWVELPKDADGVPVRVGDELCNYTLSGYPYPNGGVYCKAIVNERMILVGQKESSFKDLIMWEARWCHHRQDTWERILHDAMAYAELPTDMDMQLLVARCKALCERTKEEA